MVGRACCLLVGDERVGGGTVEGFEPVRRRRSIEGRVG